MFKPFKRKLVVFAAGQLGILLISLIFYRKITLLYYINISFCVSALLLFAALLIFITRTGFFDVVGKSFAAVLAKRGEKRKFSEITPLSQLVTIDQTPLLQYGLSIGALMLIALAFYYV